MISEQRKNISAIILITFLWVLVHGALVMVFGYRDLHDAGVYLREADFFLANGKLHDLSHAFYLTHITLITFFRWLFPGHVYPIILFQCVVSGFAVLLLYKASVMIFSNRLSGFLAAVIFLCWWDNIQWNTTLMTESLACSLMCFLIYRLSIFKGKLKDFTWILILLTLGFFTRPTGVIPIVGVIIFLLVYYRDMVNKVRGLIFFISAILLLGGILAADQMFLRWDFTEQYVQGNIVTYMNVIEGSELYEPSLRLDPTELILPSSQARPLIKMLTFMYQNPIHFLKASSLKFWYLISGIRPYYSTLHNVVVLIWMMVIYGLFYLGWKQLANKPFRFFVMVIILVNCLLVSISTVDWDNRFYIPMEPVIVLVAGRGAVYALDAYKRLSLLGSATK